jgi:hypothetical protein
MNANLCRPAPRIVNHFEVVATSSGLVMGDFKWAVQNGIAIIHDGLARNEAQVMARRLNLQLDGFRKMIGLQPMEYEQLNLVLSPVLMASPTRTGQVQQKVMKETKGRKAA